MNPNQSTPDTAADERCLTCGLLYEEPDEPIQPGDYYSVDPTNPRRCPGCGMVPSRESEAAERVAWAPEHRTVIRSHGCDSPAPECACGSPATPHRFPERPATPHADDASTPASERLTPAEHHRLANFLEFYVRGAETISGLVEEIRGIVVARVADAEAKARAGERKRIAQAIEALPTCYVHGEGGGWLHAVRTHDAIAAVRGDA